MNTRPLLLATSLLLAACATGPTYGPSDDTALEKVRLAHQACLQQQTVALINGSDDVNFLTQHIVSQCDGALQPASEYLRGRGFSSYFIQSFLQEKRSHAMQVTSDFILRVKSIQNGSPPAGGAAPYF